MSATIPLHLFVSSLCPLEILISYFHAFLFNCMPFYNSRRHKVHSAQKNKIAKFVVGAIEYFPSREIEILDTLSWPSDTPLD